jgi:succinyl-CoA:acetate CoA-transferase
MNPVMQGMHDIYYGTRLPPHRTLIPILGPGDRIGETTFRCDPSKVIAVVETNAPDRNTTFAPPDQTSKAIAGHILESLGHEVRRGKLPLELLPIQSGVGNVANAVMAGLEDGPFTRLIAYRTAC